MGKILTGFLLGVCCLALLYLFIHQEQTTRPTVMYTVEPVAEPVIIDRVQPYQPAQVQQTLVVTATPLPRWEAPKLPEVGAGGVDPVKREGWTEEIKDGLTTAGGRNK